MRTYELGICGKPILGTFRQHLAVPNQSTVKDCLTVHRWTFSTANPVVKETLATARRRQGCDKTEANYFAAEIFL